LATFLGFTQKIAPKRPLPATLTYNVEARYSDHKLTYKVLPGRVACGPE
jgi:hypothetical protein